MKYQGKFRPRNPQKYKGDPTNIVYRSSWELRFMNWCDTHSQVAEWASEEIAIPYRSPIDGKFHRYFPDFVIRVINNDGRKETIMIEVKPEMQTRPPLLENKTTKGGGISKRYIQEVKTWGINEAKWKAASEYCEDRGWKFMVFTEKHLGIK